MRTIAVVNQKGGCGKTTVSINLASALAELGKRTLLVDLDPQSHCAVGLAVPEDQIEQSVYDVLISKSRGEPVRLKEILWQISDHLELAPASIDLSAFEQQMVGIMDRESCLRNVLSETRNDYDYTVIDCPPAVGLLTFNALRAATDVIVPAETGYFALHGLSKQLETLSILCKRCNQHINVRVLTSMYDIRTKMAREILGELRSHFSDKMFKTVVNFNTKIKEAASFGQPICEYDPASKGQADFRALAEEVIALQAKSEQHQMVNTLAGQLERISSSADELLKTAKPQPVKTEEPKPQPLQKPAVAPVASVPAKPPQRKLEEKLSDYYGVNHINGSTVFVSLYPHAQEVYIAGDFNNWHPQKTKMQKVGSSGVWQAKMNLQPGRYRYRLVVDGKWQQDPYNETIEMNPFGELNSVVEVS
ncbi:MAG: AAA family ATPase [Sedimentisphaerales bacterium]|nr:AAA family ATPase [Sedimentisphaerales bacterium]